MKDGLFGVRSIVMILIFICVIRASQESFVVSSLSHHEETSSVSPGFPKDSPVLRENMLISQDANFNVSGVRICNFYPLDLTCTIFCKIGAYSEAKLDEAFATVLGFNESGKSSFLTTLYQSSDIVSESIEADDEYNYVRYRFKERPKMDFFLFPYMLVSTEEICNSTEWIGSLELYQQRWNAVYESDGLMQRFLSHFTPARKEWIRPCSFQSFPIITSVEDIEPSVHMLYELGNGTIPPDPFRDLFFCHGSAPAGGIIEHMLAFDYGFWELPHISMRAHHLDYYDIAVVSYNDNHRVSSSVPYGNEAFPNGQISIQTNFIWHVDSLLRYASNHATDLKVRITKAFEEVDGVADDLNNATTISDLEDSFVFLSTEFSQKLADYQNEIFDLQDLSLHCTRIHNDFRNTTYMDPFEETLQELSQLIEEETARAETRHLGLKANLDSVMTAARQMLADAQFRLSLDTALAHVFWSIAFAIFLQMISLGYKIWNNHRIRKRDSKLNRLDLARNLTKASGADQLRAILKKYSLSTDGGKLILALRLVQEKGEDFALELLEEIAVKK